MAELIPLRKARDRRKRSGVQQRMSEMVSQGLRAQSSKGARGRGSFQWLAWYCSRALSMRRNFATYSFDWRTSESVRSRCTNVVTGIFSGVAIAVLFSPARRLGWGRLGNTTVWFTTNQRHKVRFLDLSLFGAWCQNLNPGQDTREQTTKRRHERRHEGTHEGAHQHRPTNQGAEDAVVKYRGRRRGQPLGVSCALGI